MTFRLRVRMTASATLGLVAVLVAVGALFPPVGDAIGKLHLPDGVSRLLGGANYSTITGWYRSEIASVYGPLVIAAVAIAGAVGATAGEEEDRILSLVLAHPVQRSGVILAKAGAIAVSVVIVAAGTWLGLLAGVAVGGGGISVGNMAAFCLHLAFFGFATGSLALALGAGTGQKALAVGVASAVAIFGFLVNGFAPLVDAIAWLKYTSPFYYYAGSDPLARGVDVVDLIDLIVLGLFSVALTALAATSIEHRDLRA